MAARIALLVLLIGTTPIASRAQDRPVQDRAAPADSSSVVELVLQDGSRLVGVIESESAGSIIFRTVGGLRVDVDPATVRSRRLLPGRMVSGEYRPRDPNVSRLLFTATGRPLGKGSGYFADYYLFFPFVAYGVSPDLTLAGGISLIPASSTQLVYIAPKFTLVNRPEGALSVGILAGTATGEDEWGGLLYGVGTVGSDDAAFTGGVGFLFGGGEVYDTPIMLAGGNIRLSNALRFITENYLFFSDGGHMLVSGGIRFYGERLAADLGLITSPELLDDTAFPFAPFVGFAYNFGK